MDVSNSLYKFRFLLKIDKNIRYGIISSVVVLIYVLILRKSSIWIVHNDTCSMLVIVNGDLSGVFSPNMLFTNNLFSQILTSLYSISHSIQWYYLLLLLSIVFSIWVIIYRTLICTDRMAIKNRLIVLFITIVIANCIFYGYFTTISFTESATACGLALLFYLITNDDYRIHDYLIVLILSILCFGIRDAVMEAVLPYIIVFLLLTMIKNKFRLRDAAIYIMIFCVVYLMSLADMELCTEEQKSTREINSYRSIIADYNGGYPEYKDNINLYSDLGMNEDDYRVLNLSNGLIDFFRKDVLKSFTEHYAKNKYKLLSSKCMREMKSRLGELFHTYHGTFWTMLFLTLAFLLYYLIMSKDHFDILVISFACLISISELMYLLYNGRIVKRATEIVFYILIIIVGGIFIKKINSFYQCINNLNTELVYIVLMCIYSFCILYSSSVFYDEKSVCDSAMADTVLPEKYFMDNSGYRYYLGSRHTDYYDLFDTIHPQKRNFCKFGGWISETPEWKSALCVEYNNVWDALAYRGDLRFYFDEWEMMILEHYLNTHGYNVKAVCENVNTDDIDFEIWRFEDKRTYYKCQK